MMHYFSGDGGTSKNRRNPEELIECSIMLSFDNLRNKSPLEYDRDHGLPTINRLIEYKKAKTK